MWSSKLDACKLHLRSITKNARWYCGEVEGGLRAIIGGVVFGGNGCGM